MAKKKNPAAVALANLRMKKMSEEERSAVARAGGSARMDRLTAEQRSEIARNCDARSPALLIIFTARETTKGKVTSSCSRQRKSGSKNPEVDYAVGSASAGD